MGTKHNQAKGRILMVESEAKEVLAKLFVAFPQLRAWLAGSENANEIYRVWLRVLEGCGADDATEIVDRMIVGDLVIEAYDREKTAQVIRREANHIRSAKTEKARMRNLSFAAKDRSAIVRRVLGGVGSAAIRLGELKKFRGVSQFDHDKMLEELLNYDHGAAKPDWMDGLEARLTMARNTYYGSMA